jgi:hypothetical protein
VAGIFIKSVLPILVFQAAKTVSKLKTVMALNMPSPFLIAGRCCLTPFA